MTKFPPDYGIEIDLIDNSGDPQKPVANLGGGFMCNTIEQMADFCEETAKKLRRHARETGVR